MLTLTLRDGSIRALTPWPSGERAIAVGSCPLCGAEEFPVAGHARHIESHDTYAASAESLCCRQPVGTIRVRVETLFGLEEDEAVLIHGRARVY